MPDTTPSFMPDLPGFHELLPAQQEQLRVMAANMEERGLPAALVASGLRSTAALLFEERQDRRPRMETEAVQRFLDANGGTPVTQRSNAVPGKETKQRAREELRERLVQLTRVARSSKRRHEILRVRRELLALDQNAIRRRLGSEGEVFCAEINAWLIQAATQIHRG